MPGASEGRTGARGTVEDLSLDKWEEFTSWWVWSAGERAVPGPVSQGSTPMLALSGAGLRIHSIPMEEDNSANNV